jgi:hypothetical protein
MKLKIKYTSYWSIIFVKLSMYNDYIPNMSISPVTTMKSEMEKTGKALSHQREYIDI